MGIFGGKPKKVQKNTGKPTVNNLDYNYYLF